MGMHAASVAADSQLAEDPPPRPSAPKSNLWTHRKEATPWMLSCPPLQTGGL